MTMLMWIPLVRGRLLHLNRVVTTVYTRNYKAKQLRCEPHMNELPIPCGPWDIYYKNRQSFYTSILAAGTVWLLVAVAAMIGSGAFDLNFSPPLVPSEPTEMIEECED